MDSNKFLTEEELALIRDTDFLIKKREVLKRVATVLSDTEIELKNLLNQSGYQFPQGTLIKSGKLSRGENYKGLPYLVMDYPRFSQGKQLFIYRTMFWWGHYFLCLLVTQNCGYQLPPVEDDRLMVNYGASPWNYDLTDEHWKVLGKNLHLTDHPFIALGKTLNFEKVDELPQFSRTTFRSIMSFLTNSAN